jgi:spore maturation protein CgeB
MKILYIGHSVLESTSRHRADALMRLGHEVVVADPYTALSMHMQGHLHGALHFRSGYRLLQGAACTWVNRLQQQHAGWPELIWVDSGELIGFKAATSLRQFGCPMALYNIDDPSGHRDGRRWDSLLSALPAYDLCAVVRMVNIAEFHALGARSVHRVWRSYDEVAHRPYDDIEDIPATFRSDVAFVGTWMRGEGRDEFLLALIERGLDVVIWGDRWQKAPGWPKLRAHWRGPALAGREYVAALQGAKLVLGFLSRGNRDLHTTRSAEIPYAGGLLCAERTSEHLAMYRDGEEAVFWKDPDECAAVCHKLLTDDVLRERIRQQGMARVRAGGYGNEAVCREILEQLARNQNRPKAHPTA